jgi:aspartate aminotransferase-like enzyme
MVHPRVYQALSKPIVGHLDPFFIQVMQDVQELLKRIFGTKDASVLVISGTGSAGMEAAVANFVEPGAKFAVFANGYFSDNLRRRRDFRVYSTRTSSRSWLCPCGNLYRCFAAGPRNLCSRA